jgi:hypothetical protein
MPKYLLISAAILSLTGCSQDKRVEESISSDAIHISGIYPHLAFYNEEDECGTGAVVPWADRLWAITYGPHLPYGSSDKLYEITPDLKQIVRKESLGGTPANRMIHKESRQLFIGPYAINHTGQVRAIPYEKMPGRHTGNARHLTDPEGKIYYATMEEGFYEVDVHSLEVNTLVADAHELPESEYGSFLPGAHGKGLYSGQGVLVYSNNGERSPEALKQFDVESGALMEWDGDIWKVIRRNQFTEVTGPGGIYGNISPETDPIWTTGWDHRSLLLGVRSPQSGSWSFYRLPKSSHSYDGAHGWNTEWPRIRDVGKNGTPDYLMTMHGMFWHFPESFSAENSAGIRPGSDYLKVVGDFAPWKGKIVLGCDDSAHREFLNKRKVKGSIEGPGQSNSNLWFIDPARVDHLGPTTAAGAVWLNEEIRAGVPSEPFLFAGWPQRSCWLSFSTDEPVSFTFEIDREGKNEWTLLKEVKVAADEDRLVSFSAEDVGEWIRVITNRNTWGTVQFCFNEADQRDDVPDPMFNGLARANQNSALGGLLYGLGNNQRNLGLAGMVFDGPDQKESGYYELNEKLELKRVENPDTHQFIKEKFAIPGEVITIETSSVLITDDLGRRWRLPLGEKAYTELTKASYLRLSREVATERDLFSCHGTFYELPAENADGFAKIRPIASHPFRIHDYASFRGMLIMTGIHPEHNRQNPHLVVSEDGNAAVWAGVIDDLWKMGKPRGQGGPWLNAEVEAGEASDPYLIGFYDERTLELNHQSNTSIEFHIEVEPVGHGPWINYKTVTINPGETFIHRFPDQFQSRWIRFRSLSKTSVTAWLTYE